MGDDSVSTRALGMLRGGGSCSAAAMSPGLRAEAGRRACGVKGCGIGHNAGSLGAHGEDEQLLGGMYLL